MFDGRLEIQTQESDNVSLPLPVLSQLIEKI